MRLAVAGKGGAGKTTISATLARLAAREGRPVVAIDADANPNLAPALGGLTRGVTPGPVPSSMVSRRQGGPGLTASIEEVLSQFSVSGPDGIRLLAMGAPQHAEEGCLCSAHAVIASILEDLGGAAGETDRLVVVDMEASPEHLSRGTVRHVDTVCLVAEPYYRSLETVRRMAALVAELPVGRVTVVANKVRTPDDELAIAEFCERHGFELAGSIPWSDEVLAADRNRVSAVDWPGASNFVDAVSSLAQILDPRGS